MEKELDSGLSHLDKIISSKHNCKFFFIMSCLLFVVVLIMLFNIGDTVKKLDLEDLYDEFGGNDSFEKSMTFSIHLPDNCTLKGEYKGDSFREIIASGEEGSLCNKFNYEKGKDPDEFTDKLIRSDISAEINRKLEDTCLKIDKEDDCTKRKEYCKWINNECIFKNN